MSEPEVLARADEIGAEHDRFELASLDAFVRVHYPRLVRLAGLITRDADQAQDAVQAALERAWRNDARRLLAGGGTPRRLPTVPRSLCRRPS